MAIGWFERCAIQVALDQSKCLTQGWDVRRATFVSTFNLPSSIPNKSDKCCKISFDSLLFHYISYMISSLHLARLVLVAWTSSYRNSPKQPLHLGQQHTRCMYPIAKLISFVHKGQFRFKKGRYFQSAVVVLLCKVRSSEALLAKILGVECGSPKKISNNSYYVTNSETKTAIIAPCHFPTWLLRWRPLPSPWTWAQDT